ncbi:MAG TPA: riboflavin synthase [Candidatus Polarisedimenticolia bacterium]|nr:riboflavin synthase [Candidatus Polarisedimenticolia bacterium]
MFTGIVEGRGRIETAAAAGAEHRLRVAVPFAEPSARGGSVAVNGVCLTVVASGAGWFEAALGEETLRRTTLGDLRPGDEVNLERPLRLGDPLGGHLVQGHVDGVVRVIERRDEGAGARLRLALPGAFAPFVVGQGAVALDGVSLTVAQRSADAFEVMLIPETLRVTTLGARREGESVNLEVDLVGRYVVAAMAGREVTA